MYTPEQKALLAIQQIDVDIAKIQRAIDGHEAKQRIAAVRSQIAQADAILEKLTVERGTIHGQYIDAQLEVEGLVEKIAVDKVRLNGGLGHREAGHVQRDIDAMVRRIDALEFGEIGLLDRRDAVDSKIALLTEKRAEFEAAAEELTDRFRTLASHAQARIAQMNKQRVRHAELVGADVLARYEAVALAKAGVGVGSLEGDSCSSCKMVIATSQADALLSGPPIGTCPMCRRLIVVPQPGESEA